MCTLKKRTEQMVMLTAEALAIGMSYPGTFLMKLPFKSICTFIKGLSALMHSKVFMGKTVKSIKSSVKSLI